MVMKKGFFRWLPILALTTALSSNFYQNHDDIAQARNLRRVSNGFAFEIQNCNKDNNSVVCTFMVANLGEVRDLTFYPKRPRPNIISRPKVFLVKEYTRIKIILIASYFFSKIELATTYIHFSYRTA
ncbi:exported hypothetical protein [Microcystis aeruginosa PCC 9806]|uniref:Uncharacterized protein n=1 Tax=Microcystis aeruginosa PCC 9806 TaxID=1160282 RepID=I4GXG8_MICAE|nr:hypothetical protein [Microcystis aeruginosa]CCI14492.1 exported hypothetical protein [Microcystis aeruginosa PCC 9806]